MSSPVRIDGLEPKGIFRPQSANEVAEVLREAADRGRTVLPCGQRTRMNSGGVTNALDHLLLTSALTRLVHYEPDDLTVTVEAGSGLRELSDALRERRQFLPVQDRSARGTVGGLLATADEGGAALRYGGIRDYVTGLGAVLADGSVVKSGGRVVKNVAGYGIHRLMVGSRGTLGVIVEVSFRVQPLPETEGCMLAAFASREDAFLAARAIIASGMEPLFANVLDDGGRVRLAVGFDGTESRVAAHLEQARSCVAPFRPDGYSVLSGEERQNLRRSLDEPAVAVALDGAGARNDRASSRASLSSSARASASHATDQGQGQGQGRGSDEARPPASPGSSDSGTRVVVRLTAKPSELEGTVSLALDAARAAGATVRLDARPGLGSAFLTLEASDLRKAHAAFEAALAGARTRGHAAIVDAPADLRRAVDPWGPPPPDLPLMRRIKAALDPTGLFAAGRFVGGL